MANLKQLAQSRGLSITTVSRALDGYADVSAVTRERVREAADKVGYRPNASARRLRKQRAELVAVTLPNDPGHIGPPHFLDMCVNTAIDALVTPGAPVAVEEPTAVRLLDILEHQGARILPVRSE